MEIQKNSNSQSNLENEERNWTNQPAWLHGLLQSHSHQDNMILAQRQKYRSMEQTRKPIDKSMHLCTLSLIKEAKELTHWKRFWCLEGLGAGGEGDDRGWDGQMASPTQWTWVWASSLSWWWTGKLGVLQSMGLQRVRHDWVTELNWLNYVLGNGNT